MFSELTRKWLVEVSVDGVDGHAADSVMSCAAPPLPGVDMPAAGIVAEEMFEAPGRSYLLQAGCANRDMWQGIERDQARREHEAHHAEKQSGIQGAWRGIFWSGVLLLLLSWVADTGTPWMLGVCGVTAVLCVLTAGVEWLAALAAKKARNAK